MRPAASYLRCSTDAQQESIFEQRKQIERHAAGLGYAVIEEFADDGISGRSTDRPGLQALIAACENGAQWDAVFVWDRKRLGRPEDPIDVMALTSQIAKAGKKIVPLHGAQLTGNRLADNVVELVEFGQAGLESIGKSKDVLRGQHHVAETGAHVCGRAPFGTDALYMAGGKPVRRVRYAAHGKAELSVNGTEVLRPLPKGEVRMPGEIVTLVPGEPKHAEVVHFRDVPRDDGRQDHPNRSPGTPEVFRQAEAREAIQPRGRMGSDRRCVGRAGQQRGVERRGGTAEARSQDAQSAAGQGEQLGVPGDRARAL
jgi:hypothetical protein